MKFKSSQILIIFLLENPGQSMESEEVGKLMEKLQSNTTDTAQVRFIVKEAKFSLEFSKICEEKKSGTNILKKKKYSKINSYVFYK